MATGLQDIPMRRIPQKWDPKWFADFVRDVLRLADVRNMRVATEMTLDGQSSEFASLSMTVNGLALDRVAQQAALSVIGNPTNVTATLVAITAGTDGHVLRRSGTAVAFGTVATAGITDNAVTDEKLRDSAGLSVIGRSANSSGDPADMAAGTDGHIMRRAGASIGFGTILAASVSDFTEAAQDAVGAALVDTTTIDLAYVDATPAITASVITDSIDNTLLANMAQDTFKGRATGAGTGDPTDLTAAQALAILGLTGLVPVPGTYTPTLTNDTNLDASTAYQCQYLRVGSKVIVSGKADVDPTAAGSTVLRISLPVASNLGALEDCAGVGFAPGVAGQGAGIEADITNDAARMRWIAVDITNRAMMFLFFYDVI